MSASRVVRWGSWAGVLLLWIGPTLAAQSRPPSPSVVDWRTWCAAPVGSLAAATGVARVFQGRLPTPVQTAIAGRLVLVPLAPDGVSKTSGSTGGIGNVWAAWSAGSTRDTLFWRVGVPGRVVYHELVHAGQYRLSLSGVERLLARLEAYDREIGWPHPVVEEATASVRAIVFQAFGADVDEGVRRRFEWAIAQEGLRSRGLVTRRVGALLRAFDDPHFTPIHMALGSVPHQPTPRRVGSMAAALGRSDWTWRQEVRALLLFEVMAYAIESSCDDGVVSPWWPR